MSFIEVIACLFIITMMCSIVLGMSSIVKHNMSDSISYSRLKAAATDKIEQIRSDLESGIEIDSMDYNDYEGSNGVITDVQIDYIEDIYGKPLYKVKLKISEKKTREETSIDALLREGCTVTK